MALRPRQFAIRTIHSIWKLALEFVIEIAKVGTMSTQEVKDQSFIVVVQNKELKYDLSSIANQISSIQIFDTSAKAVVRQSNLSTKGSLSLQGLPNGFYIAVFKDEKGKSLSKKFLLK